MRREGELFLLMMLLYIEGDSCNISSNIVPLLGFLLRNVKSNVLDKQWALVCPAFISKISTETEYKLPNT